MFELQAKLHEFRQENCMHYQVKSSITIHFKLSHKPHELLHKSFTPLMHLLSFLIYDNWWSVYTRGEFFHLVIMATWKFFSNWIFLKCKSFPLASFVMEIPPNQLFVSLNYISIPQHANPLGREEKKVAQVKFTLEIVYH